MSVVEIVVPVFALIAVGYVAARLAIVSDAMAKGLSEFAFTLAMPALLFRAVGGASVDARSALGLLAAFFGAIAMTWAIASLVTAFVLRRPQADAASIAMTSCYGNVVMLGLPLAFSAFGDAAAAPVAVLLSLHTAVQWLAGELHLAFALRAGSSAAAPDTSARSLGPVLSSIVLDLIRNPLIVAIGAGVIWRCTGLQLPATADRCLMLIAQAGVPCALVALGTTLTRFSLRGQTGTLTTVLVLKLLVMPALTWWLAYRVFNMSPVAAGVCVLFAAMPAGANAYLFAERSGRAVNSASGAVALGSALSLVTSAILIALLHPA